MRFPATVCSAGLALAALVPLKSAGAQAPDSVTGFQTPSGRIHCDAYPTDTPRTAVLRCDITGPEQPRVRRPRGCELDYGYAFELFEPGGKSALLCAGDTVADPRRTVLAYGSSWEFSGLRCDVTAARLRCENKSAHGFELSPRRRRLF